MDIQPDNILIDSSFTVVKLCDFGAALLPSELAALNDSVESEHAYIAARYDSLAIFNIHFAIYYHLRVFTDFIAHLK